MDSEASAIFALLSHTLEKQSEFSCLSTLETIELIFCSLFSFLDLLVGQQLCLQCCYRNGVSDRLSDLKCTLLSILSIPGIFTVL